MRVCQVGRSKCKDPKAEMSLACSENRKKALKLSHQAEGKSGKRSHLKV